MPCMKVHFETVSGWVGALSSEFTGLTKGVEYINTK